MIAGLNTTLPKEGVKYSAIPEIGITHARNIQSQEDFTGSKIARTVESSASSHLNNNSTFNRNNVFDRNHNHIYL